jgi:RecA/RadA recombinase
VARPKKIRAEKVKKPRKVREPKELKVAKVKPNANTVFFEKLAKSTGNELAQAACNGIVAGDITGWIDTGVYILNGQLSGSIYGGVPNCKIIVFAGPEAVGKTYFILSIIKHFLDTTPDGGVFLFESEGAISKEMLVERGIDTTRLYVVSVSTIQEWRTQALKILRVYQDAGDNQRPMLFALDSLGNLSTTKEMADTESGSEKADMTRARLIKAAFRTITLKLGVLKVPFFVTNHTYDTQGVFSTKVQSGGSGVKYANSITVFLSKSKEKEGTNVVGSLIRSQLKKGRLTKEETKVEMKLYNDARGLDRYYGLLDLAIKYDIAVKAIDKKGKVIKDHWVLGGEEGSEKVIYAHPEKYFTKEVLDQLDIAAGKEYKYGSNIAISESDEVSEIEEDNE